MKNNKSIKIRSLSKMSAKDILLNLKGGLVIEFEDGIKKHLKMKDIILSRYYWSIMFMYPEVKIDSECIITNYFKNNIFSTDTHIDFLYNINKRILNQYVKFTDDKALEMEKVHSIIHDTTEKIYHELAGELKEYMTSIDLIDMLEIQQKEDILLSIENVKNNLDTESVRMAYEIFDRVISEDESLRNNPAVLAYVSGSINSGQMKNMLSVGGFKTDANGKIFPYPIAESLMRGYYTMYDALTEQRTAVKAIFLSTRAIQSTETLAKELQLLAMYIERIYRNDDCQTTNYVEWFISGDKKDLDNILGSYYLNEETGCLEVITENHKHLLNNKIKLRNPIGCRHWDKHAVCGVCFGDLSYQLPATANVGHYSGVNITGPATQLSLKTKHHNDSASAEAIILDNVAQMFFTIKNKNTYHMKKINIDNAVKVELVAPQDFLHGIKDINIENLEKIDIFKVTRIEYFDLVITKSNGDYSVYRINVKTGNRLGVFTTKMLKFIIDNDNYEIIDGNKYKIDITKLKENIPLIVLPDIEYNYLSLALDLKALLKKVTSKDNPYTFLNKLYTLINSKLKINIAYVSILVRALMIQDARTRNFDLPTSGENMQIAKMTDVIRGRSLSNSLILGYAAKAMTSAYSFEPTNRPNSVEDVLFKPEEAIYYSRKRKKALLKRKDEMKIK